jgi:putative hydrolase of the HAD superfamily
MLLKAVGFDIDGTLYPDHRVRLRSILFFLRNIRVFLAFSRTRRVMRMMDAEESSDRAGYESEAAVFAGQLGCTVPQAEEIRDRIVYRGWEGYFKGMRIYPGVRESLKRLKGAGLKLAVLSDFPVGRKLEYFGLADLFDAALGYPESGRLKPRPEPFLRMADQLGADPGEIIFVGNSLPYDVRGAENAGMKGALVGPPGRRAPAEVTTFRDYRHLAERILSEVKK